MRLTATKLPCSRAHHIRRALPPPPQSAWRRHTPCTVKNDPPERIASASAPFLCLCLCLSLLSVLVELNEASTLHTTQKTKRLKREFVNLTTFFQVRSKFISPKFLFCSVLFSTFIGLMSPIPVGSSVRFSVSLYEKKETVCTHSISRTDEQVRRPVLGLIFLNRSKRFIVPKTVTHIVNVHYDSYPPANQDP